MGGWTEIRLRDKSERNIERLNALLDRAKIAKKFRFYSIKDVEFEYSSFVAGKGVFPEDMFPRHLINSFKDFREYWNPKKQPLWCRPFGSLTLDCYYGRTSERAMFGIGKFIIDNLDEIEEASGEFGTYIERGMTPRQQEKVKNSHIKYTR